MGETLIRSILFQWWKKLLCRFLKVLKLVIGIHQDYEI